MAKLRPHHTHEDECVGDIKRRFTPASPHAQGRVRVSPAQVVGNAICAFYRGQQTGVHDAYKTIRKAFPKAAAALLKAYDMDKKGDIEL